MPAGRSGSRRPPPPTPRGPAGRCAPARRRRYRRRGPRGPQQSPDGASSSARAARTPLRPCGAPGSGSAGRRAGKVAHQLARGLGVLGGGHHAGRPLHRHAGPDEAVVELHVLLSVQALGEGPVPAPAPRANRRPRSAGAARGSRAASACCAGGRGRPAARARGAALSRSRRRRPAAVQLEAARRPARQRNRVRGVEGHVRSAGGGDPRVASRPGRPALLGGVDRNVRIALAHQSGVSPPPEWDTTISSGSSWSSSESSAAPMVRSLRYESTITHRSGCLLVIGETPTVLEGPGGRYGKWRTAALSASHGRPGQSLPHRQAAVGMGEPRCLPATDRCG